MNKIFIFLLFFHINAIAQTSNYEQKVFNFFFDSVLTNTVHRFNVIEFSGYTESKLSWFKSYENCFQDKNTLRQKLSESTRIKILTPEKISILGTKKVSFKSIHIKSARRAKIFIYSRNTIDNRIYVLIEVHKKYQFTDAYMFELDEYENILGWCYTGVVY